MSIYNIASENEFQTRFKTVYGENLYQKSDLTGKFERVLTTADSAEPISLPPYLKPNFIKVDGSGGGTNTLIDENSVDVNDLTGVKSSSLQADRLVFGDTSGNTTLEKADIVSANKLSTALSSAIGTATNDSQSLLIYDSSSNKISKSNSIRLTNTSVSSNYNIVDSSQIYINNSAANYNAAVTSANLTFNATGYLSKLYSDRMFILGTASLVFAQIQPSQIRIGVSTSLSSPVVDTTKAYATLARSGLNLHDGTSTYSLLVDDVKTTNKLRTLNSTTPGTNSKMLIYDPTTTAFNYTDIPLKDITSATSGVNSKMLIYDTATAAFNYTDMPTGGGTVPTWVETNRAYFKEVITGTPGGTITDEMVLNKSLNISTRQGTSRSDSSITYDGFESKNTLTESGGGAYSRMKFSSGGITIGNKIIGSPETAVLVTADNIKSLGKTILEWAPTNATTWYRYGGSSSTTHGQGQLESGYYQLGSAAGPGEYPLKVVLTTSVVGNCYCPVVNTTAGQWLKINFATNSAKLRFSATGTMSKSYLPIRFADVSDRAIFDVWCDDSRLNVKLVAGIFEHKTGTYGAGTYIIVIENVSGVAIDNVFPIVFIKYHFNNATKTGDAVVTSPAP